MKKVIAVLLALIMVFSVTGCSKEIAQDNSPVTMLITLGNGEAYYTQLAEMIKEKLGIEVEFVYHNSCDSSSMTKLYFANQDLPADIVFTASKTDNALLKDSCVDLLSRSSVASEYTQATLSNCITADGAIYQLPISSKLIGITYNETLLTEMGWELPETFEDMVELKAKCDEAGIKFAVTDGAATGHGFNLLFHLMGAQWLSKTDGTSWFEAFQAGTESADEFMKASDYFKRWTEAGLWGVFHTQDWGGNDEFMKTRALFWFSILNSVDHYDGPEYDDEGNETGKELHDTYKTIPWISEDGANNCYTYYDNCWVYVNKALEAPEESEKLQKVFQILEFVTTDEATALISSISKDSYVSVNNYEISDDRLYSSYNESIKTGFIQPWYYNSFDTNSIVITGEVINNYIAGKGSFEDIFTTLEKCNDEHLSRETQILSEFPEGLDYENTAKLVAIASAEAIDRTLAENGIDDRVDVAIAPYATEYNPLPPWKGASVCNSVVYKGTLEVGMSTTIFPNGAVNPCAIYMTGYEIKAITDAGFDPSDRFIDKDTGESTFDAENYGPYPYVCLVKNNQELEDDTEYLVALNEKFLTDADYTAFNDAGKVLSELNGLYSLNQGLQIFAEKHPQITAEDLVW